VRDNDRAYGHVFTSSGEGDGYPRSTDLSWITVAEWLCRTSDRHIVLRVPGSSAHLRRGAPAANSFRLCGVLQSSAHALGITERCALASSRPTIWRYRRHSDPGWTASPIPPDMIFGKDSRSKQSESWWIWTSEACCVMEGSSPKIPKCATRNPNAINAMPVRIQARNVRSSAR